MDDSWMVDLHYYLITLLTETVVLKHQEAPYSHSSVIDLGHISEHFIASH